MAGVREGDAGVDEGVVVVTGLSDGTIGLNDGLANGLGTGSGLGAGLEAGLGDGRGAGLGIGLGTGRRAGGTGWGLRGVVFSGAWVGVVS